MEILGMLFLIVGFGIMIVGGIWLLVVAFQEGVGWGLACMFIPLAALVFAITHWENAKVPFLVNIGGIPFYILGAVLSASAGG